MIYKGIMDPLKFEDLPQIEVGIETYQIWVVGKKFQIAVKKVLSMVMHQYALYSKDNNNIKIVNLCINILL